MLGRQAVVEGDHRRAAVLGDGAAGQVVGVEVTDDEAAAQLPRIAIQKPDRIVGKDTISAMQSGIFWGYIGLIDGLVNKIKEEDGRDFTVIGTGGVASLFEGASDTIDVYDQNLTINGLLEISRINKHL